MAQLVFNLSSFSSTGITLGNGSAFTATLKTTATAPTNVNVTSGTLYLSDIRTYTGNAYLSFYMNGVQLQTANFPNKSTTHEETVALSGLTNTVLNTANGSLTFTVRLSSGTTDSFRMIAGLIGKITLEYAPALSACEPPTACSLNATIAETAVILSWSGAKAGSSNAIIGYEIQSSESADGGSWGNWQPLTTITSTATSGTLSVDPPTALGNYRRFQLRTLGAAGETYYSGWKTSSNSVRRNIPPTAPTVFTASPEVYVTASVTLNWSGTVAGTSAIQRYVIQQSESTDGAAWGSWETTATVNSSATSGTYQSYPSTVNGMYTRYRISVMDALSAVSGYVISNTVRKDPYAPPPVLTAPKDGSATYNNQPRFLIRVENPGGSAQTVYVQTASGAWHNSVDDADHFSVGGTFASPGVTVYRHDSLEPGTYTIVVQFRSALGSVGMSATRTMTVAASHFEEIVAGVTRVKASHILALRSAANTARDYYGLPAYTWTSVVVAGITQIRDWPYHILELRAALEGVVEKINGFDSANNAFDVPASAFDWVALGVGRPRADVARQLQSLLSIL
ncbi:MAG: hypothetical protein LBS11_07385 [Oscillospiraceae bacterium]|jgi:hypothetical protein|nr:hypothetical protein [Oscillospiraceae bacterium]